MITPTLGRLQRVELRAAWKNESAHFTPWLALPENIALLGDTIGTELEVQSQEQAVGPFRADILCRDTTDNSLVLIENQLERTDHGHFGQLLTYAAGLKAVTLVWIAARFTEEHRAALDWLNEITDESFHAFGLEIELWRIGDSPFAPKFNVVARPNESVRSARSGAVTTGPVAQARLEFWTGLAQDMAAHPTQLKTPKPRAAPWLAWGLGSVSTSVFAQLRGDDVLVGISVQGEEAAETLEALLARWEKRESNDSFRLDERSTGERQASAWCVLDGAFSERTRWPEAYAWLRGRLQHLRLVFRPLVAQLREGDD